MNDKKVNLKNVSYVKYVKIFKGLLDLTDKEVMIVASLLAAKKQLEDNNIDVDLFSVEIKKKIATKVGLDDFYQLNNYIKSLKEKKAIIEKEGSYILSPLLSPIPTTITFVLDGKL